MQSIKENNIVDIAHTVFDIEINSLKQTQKNLDSQFSKAIISILESKGKIVVSGMGKSGIIANKIAATLTSVGNLAVFLHPAEGQHGDLGIVEKGDVVILIGKSGESEEVNNLLPVLRKIGTTIISITANAASSMAKQSDIVLLASITQEACNLKLAPTSSTTTALVMGDALAVSLSTIKNFQEKDYALFHPAGRLGKRLTYQVSDFMHPLEDVAVATEHHSLNEILIKMTEKNLGAILIIDNNHQLKGLICDGDIKRILTAGFDLNTKAKDMMIKKPLTVNSTALAYKTLLDMQKHNEVFVMPVMENDSIVGLLKLHDLLKSGL